MPISDYNDWHNQYVQDDDDQSVWHQFVKEMLLQDNLHGLDILEIGCGRGGLSNYIASITPSPAKLFACDYSTDALKIARARFESKNQRVSWQQEDIQKLSFQDSVFDRIVSCETIEHVASPTEALAELYRVLKPSGKIYLTCPNYFNFFGLWCIYRWIIGKPYTEGQPYVNYLLLPRLLRHLRNAGFEIERYHTSHLVLPLRAHYLFFKKSTPYLIRWLGFRSFFVLRKKG